ncbi:MAG TPA: hypothetical protein PK866_07990 [Nitrospira sp.]|nr:hypothetical protein [Nitrospira sp.]
MTVVFKPKVLLAGLAFSVLCLSITHFATQYVKHALGLHYQWGFERQFNMVNEANVPTWFSSMILLLSAALLTLTARCEWEHGGRDRRYWAGLAGIFSYLSLDESAQIHETFKLGEGLPHTGIFYYSWIIVGCLGVITIGLLYLGFLARLPREIRWLFVLAGGLYVGGALGVEMLESRYQYLYGTWTDLNYSLLVGIEETMEMTGVIVFIYGIAWYLARTGHTVSLSFVHDPRAVAEHSPVTVSQRIRH